MVVHQNPVVEMEVILDVIAAYNVKVSFKVLIVKKNPISIVTPADDVVRQLGQIKAWPSRHDKSLLELNDCITC